MTDAPPVPEGFKAAAIGGAFLAHNGPLYGRLDGARFQLGFRVEARHTNPLDICRGGMLATFADVRLPRVILYQPGFERRFLPGRRAGDAGQRHLQARPPDRRCAVRRLSD